MAAVRLAANWVHDHGGGVVVGGPAISEDITAPYALPALPVGTGTG